MKRLLDIDASASPFGGAQAFAIALAGREALSELFHFEVTVLVDDPGLKPGDFLGKGMTLLLDAGDAGGERKINGVIRAMRALGRQYTGFFSYQFDLAPEFWFATLSEDCRIFQDMTVDDIVRQILDERGIGYRFATTGSRSPREYCVQYNETDFDFICRLLAEEGFYYYHEHGRSSGRFDHTLTICDSASAYFPCRQADLYFRKDEYENAAVETWCEQHQAHTAEWRLVEYNPDAPTSDLAVKAESRADPRLVSRTERFRNHGRYGEGARGEGLCGLELDREEVLTQSYLGTSRYVHFAPGAKARFSEPPEGVESSEIVLVSVAHEVRDYSAVAGLTTAMARAGDESPEEDFYSNTFTCIRSDTTFRPPIDRRVNRMRGLQSAVVVGPDGEEIYCDKYGRIRVCFHWDRKGKGKSDPTCWLRVAQMFAGPKFGAHYVPRIGMEVLVDFLEGDQDRPIVVGVVYNDKNQQPYDMAAEKTKSGWKTISSPGGDLSTKYNEIRFEDKAGDEEIWMHASKDFNREIRHDESLILHNTREETIKCSEKKSGVADSLTVELGDKEMAVKQGNYKEKVHQNYETKVEVGDMKVNIDTGSYQHTVMQNHETTLNLGNHSLDVTTGSSTISAMQKIEITSMMAIELKVGASSIKIDHTGITMKGLTVKAKAETMMDLKANAMTQVSSSGMLMAKGAITMIN